MCLNTSQFPIQAVIGQIYYLSHPNEEDHHSHHVQKNHHMTWYCPLVFSPLRASSWPNCWPLLASLTWWGNTVHWTGWSWSIKTWLVSLRQARKWSWRSRWHYRIVKIIVGSGVLGWEGVETSQDCEKHYRKHPDTWSDHWWPLWYDQDGDSFHFLKCSWWQWTNRFVFFSLKIPEDKSLLRFWKSKPQQQALQQNPFKKPSRCHRLHICFFLIWGMDVVFCLHREIGANNPWFTWILPSLASA